MDKMEKSRETKSLLAKLMAAENINVEYNPKADTAAFSTETRTLIMPVLKDMTENATDLFLGHEVGHALYTPNEAIKEAFSRGGFFKSLCNIVEDARIEKMIQGKFPGLKRSFYNGYGDLIERDFFGTKDRDVNSYNFVDRLNVHFKLGVRAGVQFSDEEMVFVNRMESLRSWDDSIKLTEDLWKYVGDNNESEPETIPEIDPDGEPGDGSDETEKSDGSGNDSNSDDNEKENAEAGDSDSEEETEESDSSDSANSGDSDDKEESDDSDSSESDEEYSDDKIDNPEDLESNTQREFDRSVRSHLDDSGFEIRYGNIPDVDIDKVLISMDRIHETIDAHIKDNIDKGYIHYDKGIGDARQSLREFISSQKSLVSYLAKEFEMRKSADEHKRTKVAKTGILNPNKLHAYKFSEDLFLRSNIVSDGKNHGFVMFIDWSGSMQNNMANTIDQLMLLALFCKKVAIPFDVFAFSTGWRDGPDDLLYDDTGYRFDNLNHNDFAISRSFKLFHLISSTVSTLKFNESMVYLRYLRECFSNSYDNAYILPDGLRLGGTPLNEAVMAAFKIVPMFQKKNKVQIINTVFLTDGQGGESRRLYDSSAEDFTTNFVEYDTKSFVIDPVTKKHYEYNSRAPGKYGTTDTELFIKALKDRTGTRISNFYIASGRKNNFSQDVAWLAGGVWDIINELWESVKVEGFAVLPEDTMGFDEFYVLSDKNLKVNVDELEIDSATMTKAKMKNNFIKNRKNKLLSKKMLSRFAEFVS